MITLKSAHEIELMRRAGKITAAARALARDMVRPGVTTQQIDKAVFQFITEQGATPSFLHYNGYPASVCVSVNDEIIHGIPGKRVLQEGDIVSVDVGAFAPTIHSSKLILCPTKAVASSIFRANCSITSCKGSPFSRATKVVIPCTREASGGIVNPSGFTMTSRLSSMFPRSSYMIQANCTNLGQFSKSVTGAFHRLGNPVVSVSKNKYIFRIFKLKTENYPFLRQTAKSSPIFYLRYQNSYYTGA